MTRIGSAEASWLARPDWLARANLAATTWLAVVALMLPLSIITVWGVMFDDRMLGDQSVWAKPTKFQASLALHFLTLALVTMRLSPRVRGSALLLVVAAVSSAAALAEIGYIFVQAARGQPSHFNVSTPFHMAMFSLMASGAVLLTCAAAIVGVLVAHDRSVALGRATQAGVVLGLALGTVLTLLTAFRLGANMSHHVGHAAAGSPAMPMTGWSLVVGDLRVPHFLATHMMQVIPVAGLMADRWLPKRAGVHVIVLLTVCWAGLVIGQFLTALDGRPLVTMPA